MVQHVSDLVTIAGQTIDRGTLAGLKSASQKSGVSFQYLLAKAAQESSLQSNAQAAGSTAAGLFQFTRGTWLEMVKRYGAAVGLGNLAQKITAGSDGKAQVTDASTESQILNLRSDPEVSAMMAAQYARDNATALKDATGRGPDASDLYLAHFLGPTGASLLLNTATDDPQTSAASLMPAAAKSNSSVFYTADGKARSAADVVKLVRERFTNQMTRFANASTAVVANETSTSATAAASASAGASPFDMQAAVQSGNPNQMTMSWYMMEQLAKLIGMSPMVMSTGGTPSDTALSPDGLQGSDWSSAISTIFSKDTGSTPPQTTAQTAAPQAPPPADQASRAYDAVKTQVAVMFNRPRNDDVT